MYYGPAASKSAVAVYNKMLAEAAPLLVSGVKQAVWNGRLSKLQKELGFSNTYLFGLLKLLRAHGSIVILRPGNRWQSTEVVLVKPKPKPEDLRATADEVMGQQDTMTETLDARIKIAKSELAALRALRGPGRTPGRKKASA